MAARSLPARRRRRSARSPRRRTRSRSAPWTATATPTRPRSRAPSRSTSLRRTRRSRAVRRTGARSRTTRLPSTSARPSPGLVRVPDRRRAVRPLLDTAHPAALTDGPHTFRVRAIDRAGNADRRRSSGASRSTRRRRRRRSRVGRRTAPRSMTGRPTFGFTADEAGSAFECAIDGGAFTGCTSPHTFGAVADGAHTFAMRATDAVGNVGAAVTRTVTIDTDPPEMTITAGPRHKGVSEDSTPTFDFIVGRARLDLRLQGEPGGLQLVYIAARAGDAGQRDDHLRRAGDGRGGQRRPGIARARSGLTRTRRGSRSQT